MVAKLTETKALYNFFHGCKTPGTFLIDEFRIEFDQENCENLKLLESGARTTFDYDQEHGRVVTIQDPVHGQYVITATVTYDNANIGPSIIHDVDTGNTTLNDLCAVLSALTGRLVFLEQDLGCRPSVKRFDGMVSNNFFPYSKVSLATLRDIKKDGLAFAFLNLCYLPTSGELLATASIANSIINVIYERWCTDSGDTKYGNKKEIDQAIDVAIKSVDASLSDAGVDQQTIDDIVARIRIDKSPSAIFKFTKFLFGFGLVEESNEVTKKRIKLVNTIRNAFVHSGSLPSSTGYDQPQLREICVSVTFLLITIAQIYFSKKYFKILEDFYVLKDEREVQSFFAIGDFRGKKVFEEKFDDYMSRVADAWINNGVFPA